MKSVKTANIMLIVLMVVIIFGGVLYFTKKTTIETDEDGNDIVKSHFFGSGKKETEVKA